MIRDFGYGIQRKEREESIGKYTQHVNSRKSILLLREAVIDGSLKPGERLVEDSLAAQYNVSRTPLREAIHKLEMEGFLQRLPSRGLVVAELSGKEVEELYQVRGYLEGLAAHEFTRNLTPDNRNMVSTLRQNVVYYHDNGEQEKVLESCKQLHRFVRRTAVTKSAGNILKRWICILPGTAGWEFARPGVWNRLIRSICRLWTLCWPGTPRPRRRP